MPAAVVAPIVASIIGGAASVYGTHKASKSSRRASDVQEQSDREALEFAKQQDAQARGDYDYYESRMRPYREAGQGALVNLAQFAKVPVPASARAPMPLRPIASVAAPGPRRSARRTVPLSSLIER